MTDTTTETAILAGGCFWGMQDLFRKLPGVVNTRAGYTGGSLPNPTYKNMDTANDSHAEALEIIFDPSRISYRRLLEFFFQIHDPTTENRQGNDIGPHYRSAIFFLSAEQEKTAHEVIAAVNASGKWPGTVKTELVKASVFYEAEDMHQDYLEKHPGGYTCHWVRPNWTFE
jgi:peptide-methionine (S)-S-oxide reductase